MVIEVKRHLLYDENAQVVFKRTPNGGGSLKPLYLIIHYTAGTTAAGAIGWFEKPEAKASAHLVIDRNGDITQMMEFNKKTWHAGKSEWADLAGLNSYSIGIELVNAGKLTQTASGRWKSWSGTELPDDEVLVATHKNETQPAGWHAFTERQIETAVEVGIALNSTYGFLDVLGHEDISPRRKVDPGPAFPLLSVQSKIMGRGLL